tara:strand:+ start:55 stop:789 length:735 start_codon:yes stop_codon:yes gene_type:complete
MGHFARRAIVTDGLVFQIDAANNLCGNVTDAKNIVNPTEIGSFENISTPPATSVIDNAYSFDGVDDYIDITNILPSLETNPTGSVELWVSIESLTGATGYVLWSFTNSGGPPDYYLACSIRSDGNIRFRNVDSSFINWDMDSTTAPIILGQMNQIVLTQGGVRPYLYLNGQLLNTTISGNLYSHWFSGFGVGTLNSALLGALEINSNGLSNFLPGDISSMKIYNKALTQAEITQNYEVQKHKYL